jgi:ABC-2 type transport system ATP-binding protein
MNVERGDIYGLVGRNGAGKTTLLKCLLGLVRPESGTISLLGDSADLDEARGRIGFMIKPAFFTYLSAERNLAYHCRLKGFDPALEIDRALRIVGLEGERKPVKSYSLGMKQRLGIAAALLGSPEIVILDEPLNGLDPLGIRDVRALIKRINEDIGATVVVSSHLLGELEMVASKFGILENGRLVEEIAHRELHARGKTLEEHFWELTEEARCA